MTTIQPTANLHPIDTSQANNNINNNHRHSSLSQSSIEYSTLMSPTKDPNPPTLNRVGLPSLHVDLAAHKLPLAIPWIILVMTSCVIPIVGFYCLYFFAPDVDDSIKLAPWLGLFGVASLHSLFTRIWRLVKDTNGCRPLGQTNVWGLDFFCWNFIFGFVVVTVCISLGISQDLLRLASLPLSILVLYVAAELVLAQVFMALGIRAPFRISSIERGASMKPASYVIAEDVVAVDANQGKAFRDALLARYEASSVMRTHLRRLDMMWGVSGLAMVAAVWGIVFGVENNLVGYGVGWALPWAWAGTMAFITFRMGSAMLAKEREMQGQRGNVA